MLEQARKALRITTDAFDGEINGLIDACKADLRMGGVLPERISEDYPEAALAILLFVKAHFGDNPNSGKFLRSYDTLKLSLILDNATFVAAGDADGK